MCNAESRLIGAWAKIEHGLQADDLSFVDDIGDDPAPIDSAKFFRLKPKKSHVDKCRARQIDISAKIFHLTGEEIDVETNTVFGRRTEKEFIFRPTRALEEHAAKVAEMEKRGYAFDPQAGVNLATSEPLPSANKDINEPDKFSPRELAPVAQAIFGIINTEKPITYNKRDRHVTG